MRRYTVHVNAMLTLGVATIVCNTVNMLKNSWGRMYTVIGTLMTLLVWDECSYRCSHKVHGAHSVCHSTMASTSVPAATKWLMKFNSDHFLRVCQMEKPCMDRRRGGEGAFTVSSFKTA